MIRLYVGKMRSGKTLNMVYDTLPFLNHGRRVISNTPIWVDIKGRKVICDWYDKDGERLTWEIMHAKGALIVIDESSLVFSSLKWNKIDLDWNAKFRQGAKQSCDMFLTTQAYIDTASSIRRIADQSTICSKYHWLVPWPLDLRREVFDKARWRYKKVGLYLATPTIYKMRYVDPAFFRTTATLPKNLVRFLHGERKLYPSQSRRVMRCYDHEYEIKFSAVGKLKYFNYEKKRVPSPAPTSVESDEVARVSDSDTEATATPVTT